MARRPGLRPHRRRADRDQDQLQPLRRCRSASIACTAVNPLTVGSRTCPWSDPNGDRPLPGERDHDVAVRRVQRRRHHRSTPDGIDWPYSDEITAGIERQVGRDMRVGVMYYHRTNRDQLGTRDELRPASAYTPFTVNVPERPERCARRSRSTTSRPAGQRESRSIRDNRAESWTPTTRAWSSPRASASRTAGRWSADSRIGKNEGGHRRRRPQRSRTTRIFTARDHRQRFEVRLPAVGQLPAAVRVRLAGSVVSNSGYPFVSTYNLTRADARARRASR